MAASAETEAVAAAAALREEAPGGGAVLLPPAAAAAAAVSAASPLSCPRRTAESLPWLDHKVAAGAMTGAATAAGTPPPPPANAFVLGSKRPRPSPPALPLHKDVALQAPSPPHAAPSAAATTTALVYDAGHTRHAHPQRKHPERPERVEAVLAHLRGRGLLDRCHLLPLPAGGVLAPEAALAGVHSQHYLTRLRRLDGVGLPRLLEEAEGFDSVYLNEATVDCARRAAGALVSLVTAVVKGQQRGEQHQAKAEEEQEGICGGGSGLRNGLALIRPPGHHAEAHHARGFCVLNNVAVAAQHARQALGVARVLVVDWDIHHGNGTQRAFLEDPSVLYVSVHRYDHGRFFPGTGNPGEVGQGAGRGFTVNVGWDGGGMGDREYAAVWRRLLLPLARAFAPELVLVSAGFDGADGDEMGGCRVTPRGFGAMTRALVEQVPSAAGRVVLALEGGYKLSVLSACVEACLEALLPPVDDDEEEEDEDDGTGKRARVLEQEEEEEDDDEGPLAPGAEEAIERALELHRPFWPCLRKGAAAEEA